MAKLFGQTRSATGVHLPFESPTVPLSSLALDSVFGAMNRSDSGEMVNADTSLGLPTFWRCVGLVSNIVAGCPIRTFRDPGKVEVFPKLLNQGNSDMTYTQYELWHLVMVHILVWGNAFVLKVRGTGPDGPNSGPITDLKPIFPGRVEVKVEKGQKVFEVTQVDANGTLTPNAPKLVLNTFNIMHIPGMGYDGIQGISVIENAKRTLGTAIAGDRLAAKFFSNGTVLSGVINVKAPLTSVEQAQGIKDKWLQKMGGVNHAGEVAILDSESTYTPLTIPPDSLQFLESRQWSCNEIARWFGVPPFLVGDTEKSTSWGTGIESINTAFVAYTISEHTNRIEQRVTREIISTNKQYAEFDLDRLLRGNMSERYTAYGIGIVNGFLSRNEARVKENMEPGEGLDEFLTPVNTAMPLNGEGLGAADPAGDAPAPVDDQVSDPS